jgi:hypothetical protein
MTTRLLPTANRFAPDLRVRGAAIGRAIGVTKRSARGAAFPGGFAAT